VQRAWYLNLDADLELGTRGHYHPSNKLIEQVKARRSALASLVAGESVLDMGQPLGPLTPTPDIVLCWSPTPSALRWLSARAAVTPPAPPVSVLQRVNHRHFVFDLHQWPHRRLIDEHELQELETQPPDAARGWRLKRNFGFAGKGQRVIRPPTTPDDRRWVSDSLRAGPLLCEPNYELVAEYTAHGYIDREGLIAGGICQQRCDAYGQVTGIERVQVSDALAGPLNQMRERLAEGLWTAGYWGPFGFDAFTYRNETGVMLNPLSDVNARFSLGWSVGMGSERERSLQRMTSQLPT
jgi:hypothetical protein